MEAIKEKVGKLIETADVDVAEVFDQAMMMAAKLEDGRILMASHVFASPEEFDREAGVEHCLSSLWDCLMTDEMTKEANTTLTMDQAKIVVAMAKHGMRQNAVAAELKYSSGTISQQVKKIREQTGKDPKEFYDMCQLLVEARQVLAAEGEKE